MAVAWQSIEPDHAEVRAARLRFLAARPARRRSRKVLTRAATILAVVLAAAVASAAVRVVAVRFVLPPKAETPVASLDDLPRAIAKKAKHAPRPHRVPAAHDPAGDPSVDLLDDAPVEPVAAEVSVEQLPVAAPVEARFSAPAPAPAPAPATPRPVASTPKVGGAVSSWTLAATALRQGDYAAAEAAFTDLGFVLRRFDSRRGTPRARPGLDRAGPRIEGEVRARGSVDDRVDAPGAQARGRSARRLALNGPPGPLKRAGSGNTSIMARLRSGPRLLAWLSGVVVLASCNGAVISLGPDSGSTSAGDGGVTAFTVAPPLGGVVQTRTVDKVDILFDIDNSASMGDKQAYLQAAIPDLVNRLVNPNCVDSSGVAHGASSNGTCSNNAYHPEFTPVRDLHLGIVSSSLGGRGGDACGDQTMALPPFQNVLAHDNDEGHLLNRTLTFASGHASVTEGVASDAPAPDQYLYWIPAAENQGKTAGKGLALSNVPATQLITDFAQMIGGVGVFGCGIESQLESWYRFLIQPDPYQSVGTTTDSDGNKHGNWQGVDQTVLQPRADFLRPDSILLIVDVSDENDSEIDVRSLGGEGVNWLSASFEPPNGTSACASAPSSSACMSCAQENNSQTDPACKSKPKYNAINDWGYNLNLRHVHMKAKYGVDVQFPMGRYVNGLTSATVPDRNGEYPAGAQSYAGMNDCVNPLFAARLPSSGSNSSALCTLTAGPRTKDMVFYAHIGGVPHQLLHFTPGDPAASTLSDDDWVKILGNGLVNGTDPYDTSGIDPHMIESYLPRTGIALPGSAPNADPIMGHDWITDQPVGVMGGHVLQVDRQYACTFPLVDSSGVLTSRDCTLAQNANWCDCPHLAGTVNATQAPTHLRPHDHHQAGRGQGPTRPSVSCSSPRSSATRASCRRSVRSTRPTTRPATIRTTATGRPSRSSSIG